MSVDSWRVRFIRAEAPCWKGEIQIGRLVLWWQSVLLLPFCALLLAGCAAKSQPVVRAPQPSALSRTALASDAALRTDTVAPTDLVAIGLCDPATPPSWNTNRYFSIDIDSVRQAFSGPLLADPVTGPTCYQTQKAFTFSAGTHDVQVALINHCATSDPDPLCKTSGVGDWPSPPTALTVVSVAQPCTYTLSAPGQSFQAPGGSGNVAVTTTAGCPWTVTSGASWLTVTAGGNSTGPGSTTFAAAANTATTGRTGVLTIAGQAFTVTQAGAVTGDPCVVGGADALSIFVTRWEPTTGKVPKPGALMRVNYQFASKSPIREIYVKAGGVQLKRIAGTDVDLTADGGLWFNAPAAGTYTLLVGAKNAVCPVREVAAPVNLVVR